LGTLGAIAVSGLLSITLFEIDAASHDGDAEKPMLARTCMQWHLAASEVVSQQVQSMRDVDLRYVSDAIFRMRRARRNCEIGWATLACQDYHSVAAGIPGHAVPNEMFPCARASASSSD
jgi:hypothetical protein